MNEIFERKIAAEQRNFTDLLEKKLENFIAPELAFEVLEDFYKNNLMIEIISKNKGIDADFFRYNEMVQLNVLIVIASINQNLKYLGIESSKENILKRLYDAVITANMEFLDDSTIFMSNPIISNISHIVNVIKKELNETNHLYNVMLNNILDSIYSLLILFDKKCYTQAMSVFRQALEHFITLKALDMNPGAIESYLEHQAITAKEVLGELSPEELDQYIKDNNLTYNTYKSYMNYGWLDYVDSYVKAKEEKPKLKYGIKVITDVTGQQEFYEAMDFASNYVHPNFIFVNVDWDMVIKEVLDGIYQMLDWVCMWFVKNNKSIDSYDVYERIKKEAYDIIKLENYTFNIR